jgi:CBS domain-containing protein
MKRSILTEKIARRGRHILREYTVDALEFLLAGQVMTPDPRTLPGTMTLSDAVTFFSEEAEHRSYPVIDEAGRLLGLVSRTDALRWKQDSRELQGHLADVLSDASTLVAFPEMPCGEVADMMVESGTGRVPIVDPETRRVIGILSRQDLLKVRSTQQRGEMVRPGSKTKARPGTTAI